MFGFGASSSSSGGGFGGFGGSSSAGGGFGGFGASSSAGGGGFGGFGASSSAAGGFGASSSGGGFGGFGASSSAAAGGFGGFGASSSAVGGFGAGASSSGGGFGASSSSLGGGFGGFGASSSSAGVGGFGASSSAAGGFGGFGASSSASGGFGGFGAGSSSSVGMGGQAIPDSWKAKTLKEICDECERCLEEDKQSFSSCADSVIRLDLALHEIGDNMLRLRSQVEDCKKNKQSLEGIIYSLENDLDSLEKKVTGEVERSIEQLAKANSADGMMMGSANGYDKERQIAYEKAKTIEDKLQSIESRLGDKVASFNHAVGDDHSTVRSLTHVLDHHVEYMRQLDQNIERVKKQCAETSERILGGRHQM